MKRYNKYKDSGIAWLGQIPEHWEVGALGRFFSFGKGLSITKANLIEEGIAVLSYGQVHSKKNSGITIDDSLIRRVSKDYLETNPQSLLMRNDFIFADTSEDLDGAGNCAFNDYEDMLFAGYHTIIARPRDIQYPKYLAYLFQSCDWRSSIQSSVDGIKVYSITKSILKKSFLLFPPLPEQAAIVSYLDRKVSELDSFVSKQETQISYLKELKQATIAKAVTRGIDPSVTLKDSGIPWLGQIPEHWEVRIGKRIYSANDGGVWGDDPDGDNDTIVLRSTEQTEDGNLQVINPAKRKLSPRERISGMLLEGDLIITKSSGSPSHIGKTSLIDKSTELLGCCYSNFIQRVRVKGSPRFYWYVFNSQFVRGQFQNLSTTTTGLGNLSGSMINNILLPLPPMPEQVAIVSYLDEKLGAIDRLIAASEAAIARVRELKQTLIADVVTGRICVQPS